MLLRWSVRLRLCLLGEGEQGVNCALSTRFRDDSISPTTTPTTAHNTITTVYRGHQRDGSCLAGTPVHARAASKPLALENAFAAEEALGQKPRDLGVVHVVQNLAKRTRVVDVNGRGDDNPGQRLWYSDVSSCGLGSRVTSHVVGTDCLHAKHSSSGGVAMCLSGRTPGA